VVEESEPGAGEGGPVPAADVLDFGGANRSARLGDVGDTVPVGMVDVVAERQRAVRDERHLGQAREPPGALLVGQLGCGRGQCGRQAGALVRGEVALDEADLPVDPVLTPEVRRCRGRECSACTTGGQFRVAQVALSFAS